MVHGAEEAVSHASYRMHSSTNNGRNVVAPRKLVTSQGTNRKTATYYTLTCTCAYCCAYNYTPSQPHFLLARTISKNAWTPTGTSRVLSSSLRREAIALAPLQGRAQVLCYGLLVALRYSNLNVTKMKVR